MDPSVLFVSCTEDERPDHLIRLMLGELPGAINTEAGIVSYPWHINTKYYEADVQLSAMVSKSLSSQHFAESVQAIVLYFDSEKPSCLSIVDDWLILLNEYEAEIKMLVCPQCLENSVEGVSKRDVQEWCLKKNFELVELNPINDDNETDEDFTETTGIKRVTQALQAHVWPNLVLKDHKDPTTMSGLLHGGRCRSTDSDYGAVSSDVTQDNIEPSLEEICDQDKVDFCTLFSQLASMKERAANLPHDERKKFAEQLVLTYWNAIGGDEDEILDC